MTLTLRSAFAAFGLATLAGPQAALAGPTAVLELFTSQGCNSCPPADALLQEIARRPDLVALTMPVDYWDYLGWRDTLASPAFSARQRAYATARRDRQVYTPQLVVNGVVPCVGSDRAEVDRLIGKAAAARGLSVEVTLAEREGRVVVEIGPGAGAGEVWLLPVKRSETVAIGRGENSGRTITYVNVVKAMIRLGAWQGAAARFEAARPEGVDGYVVLVQAAEPGRPGAILGAAKSEGL